MGNIFADIVEDIEVKPNKSKVILKWVVRIAAILIMAAFTYGQIRTNKTTRLSTIELSISEVSRAQERGFADLTEKVDLIDARIDKVYNDANEGLMDYQAFNQKQLELIIDYGAENKDMLKRMLELNSMENARRIDVNTEKAKTETPVESNIIGKKDSDKIKEFYGSVFLIQMETNDTTYHVNGATQDYITKINNGQYQVSNITQSEKYPDRFDFDYQKK